jgi:dTDP-4-dehydrorhamnose reductase
MKKILITGSTGRIGKKLLESINNNDFHNTEFLFISNSSNINNLVKSDLSVYKNVQKIINNFNPSTILHLAALTLPGSELDKDLSYNTNFVITKNLVDSCKNFKTNFIFFSTDKVYGGNIKEPKEEDDIKPSTFYGIHKLDAENYIKLNLQKFLVFRIPIIHGYGELQDVSVIDKAIQSLKDGKSFSLYNNIFRSYIYYKDLLNFTRNLLLVKDTNINGIFNIGTKAESYFDRVSNICKKININSDLLTYQSGEIIPKYQGINTSKYFKIYNNIYE